MKKILGIALMASFAGAAMAQTFGPGAGFAIADSPAAGGSSDIVVGSSNVITSFNWVSVTFSPTHTWAGDLIARITHVDTGTEVHLFSRVGSVTAGGAGDSSDLGGTYRFFDTGASFSTAAAAAGAAVIIANGDYARSTHAFGAGAGLSNGVTQFNANPLSSFNGQSLGGTWRLTISDHAGGDTGGVSEWSFNVDAVPEPASMAVLGLGAAALLRRRRK